MWLKAGQVAATFTYVGWTYALCGEEHRDRFVRTPDIRVIHLTHDPAVCHGHWCPYLRGAAPTMGRGGATSEDVGKPEE